MRVTSLRIANLRAIEAAEFRFQPGFNLIVGINGVGKSSVLDALGSCLSAVVSKVNALRIPAEVFTVSDIRVGAEALTTTLEVKLRDREHSYVLHQPRESSVPQRQNVGRPREQVLETPMKAMFLGAPPERASGGEDGGRPLAVLFSTNRAVPLERAPSKAAAAGGIAAAFADAVLSRELRLGELTAWMRVQQTLQQERPVARAALAAVEVAVSRFLPDYKNLHVAGGGNTRRLLIDRTGGTVAVRRMSDGERGMLALVLDLTRRLVLANPELSDPISDAKAVVMIDEIDLHLHPTWQRNVVRKLTETFPRCQFIATTHSPQVVGEVAHDRIHIMADGDVYSPSYSFGVDSSRILEELMDAASRTTSVAKLLREISREIEGERFGRARHALSRLVKRLGEDDPEVVRIRTLLDFMGAED